LSRSFAGGEVKKELGQLQSLRLDACNYNELVDHLKPIDAYIAELTDKFGRRNLRNRRTLFLLLRAL